MDPVYEVSDELQRVLDKVETSDVVDIDPLERKMWLKHFMYVISEQYKLKPEELFGSHDRWLRTIEYQSGISDVKFQQFENNIEDLKKESINHVLGYIVNFFTFEELSTVNINNTA
jgi:hypothetical protein